MGGAPSSEAPKSASAGSAGVAPLRRSATRRAASLGTAPAAAAPPAAAVPAFATSPAFRWHRRRGRAFGAWRLRRTLRLRLRARLMGPRPTLRGRARGHLGPRTVVLRTILLRTVVAGSVPLGAVVAGPLPPRTVALRTVAPGPVAARAIAHRPGTALLRSDLGHARRRDGRLTLGRSLGPTAPATAATALLPAPVGLRHAASLRRRGRDLGLAAARAPLVPLRSPAGILGFALTALLIAPLLFLGLAGLLADGFLRPPGGVDLIRLGPLLLR